MSNRQSKINWEAAGNDYVTGDYTLKQIADKYGVNHSTAAKMSTAHHWVQRREEYRRQTANKLREKTQEDQVRAYAKTASTMRKAADALTDQVNAILGDAQQFHRHLVQRTAAGETDTEERLYTKADTKALRDMTAALKDLAAVIRDINDMPTYSERASAEIARERLRMEQEKQQQEQTDDGYTIIIGDAAEEYAE